MALLTRLLLDAGAIDYEGVEEAIKAQVIYGGRIGTNLIELGLITEEQLCQALERNYGLRSTRLREEDIDPEALTALPEKFIRAYEVVPFQKRRMAVDIAMVDPSKRRYIADISFSTGLIIRPFVAPEYRIQKALERHFDIPIPLSYTDSYEEDVAPEDIQAALNKPIEALTEDQTLEELEGAEHGKAIPNALLGFAKQYFQRAMLFVVKNDKLIGLDGFSPPRKAGFAAGYEVDLEIPSIFRDIVDSQGTHRGPVPEREPEEDVVDYLGGALPSAAVIAPVVLRGRTVNIFYGDAGPNQDIPADLSDFFVMITQVSKAYDRLIRRRVARSLKEA